jgi:antitoxin ParD1/3/4
MRTMKPITVTLGKLQERVDARVKSGAYSSASEVIRAGLRALDREDGMLDEIWRRKIQEALDDPRPDVLLDEAFGRIEQKHAQRMKASGRGIESNPSRHRRSGP